MDFNRTNLSGINNTINIMQKIANKPSHTFYCVRGLSGGSRQLNGAIKWSDRINKIHRFIIF